MDSMKCLRKDASERFQEQILQESKVLKEEKSIKALELLGRKHKLEKLEKALGAVRGESEFAVATDGSSVCSCSLSVAYDVDEAMSMSSRKSSSMGKKRDCWSADVEGEMEKLEVEGSFSAAEGGSMDPERKAGHWSARKVPEGEEVNGAGNEEQGTEVDEVVLGMQPSSKETDGGFIISEVEE